MTQSALVSVSGPWGGCTTIISGYNSCMLPSALSSSGSACWFGADGKNKGNGNLQFVKEKYRKRDIN